MVYERKKDDEMSISENRKGFRISILLEEGDVNWLMDSLEDFYWRKGGRMWGKNRLEENHKLWFALGRNKSRCFLVLTEEKGKSVKLSSFQKGSKSLDGGI